MRIPIQAQAVSRAALEADRHTIVRNETTGVKSSAVTAVQTGPALAPVQSLPIIRRGALGTSNGGVEASWWDSGFWKDQIEDIWNKFKQMFGVMIDGVQNLVKKLNDSARAAGKQFMCGHWATQMLKCGSNGPALTVANMSLDCMQKANGVPAAAAACPALAAAMFPLVNAYCNEVRGNPNGQAELTSRILGQICPG